MYRYISSSQLLCSGSRPADILWPVIIIVILIAAILRFWQLSSLPPALDWDEVSNAYNGYSILKTGRDEFGQSFPILFRAFDGYVPPVLIYLNSISVLLFGLNEFAARVPNAILGTLTVLGIYLLVKQLTRLKSVAFFSALFLAISPWHILYSRVNTFALTPVFFVVFGTYFFLLSFKKGWHLILSTLFFVLAIFSYFSAYIFVPLFVFTLVLIYKKKLGLRNLVLMLAPIFMGSFLILFVLTGGQNRLRGISIFNDADAIKTAAEEAKDEGTLGKLLHNRRFVYAQEILKGYFINFRGDFLFGRGDAVERMIVAGPGFGLLLLLFLPFLLFGIFELVSKKPPGWQIYLAWLLLAPVAASTSLPQPVSTRTTIMIPPLVVISAYGFYSFAKSRKKFSKILVILLAANLFLFLHQYFVHFPIEKSDKWFYGYRQLFDFINRDENVNKNVHFMFSQPDTLDQIHMFLLFYNKVNPAAWQANGGTRLGCIGTTGQFSFDRYDFIPYSCLTKPVDLQRFMDNDLIVTSKVLSGKYLSKISYLDGKDAFYVYSFDKIKSGGIIPDSSTF